MNTTELFDIVALSNFVDTTALSKIVNTCVCVCVCVCERERERECVRACVRECARAPVYMSVCFGGLYLTHGASESN